MVERLSSSCCCDFRNWKRQRSQSVATSFSKKYLFTPWTFFLTMYIILSCTTISNTTSTWNNSSSIIMVESFSTTISLSNRKYHYNQRSLTIHSAAIRRRLDGKAASSSSRTSKSNKKRHNYLNQYRHHEENDDNYEFWEQPLSIQSFNMDLYNLAQENPQKAQDVLEIMEDLYRSQNQTVGVVQPNSASYTTVMEGWCYYYGDGDGNGEGDGGGTKLQEQYVSDGDDSIPYGESSVSLSTVPTVPEPLRRRATSTTTTTTNSIVPHRVQALLDHMEASDHLEPNEISYLLVCQQWADAVADETPSGRNVQRAQDLLDRLLARPVPVEVSYSSTSLTTTTDKENYSVEKEGKYQQGQSRRQQRQRRKQRQQQRGRRRQPIPISTKLYTIVLEGWCRRVGKVPHAMERVEALLRTMEEAHTNTAATTTETVHPQAIAIPRPNVLTYTSVIGSLARSKRNDLASRAMGLLPRMKAQGIQPDMVAYTSILNCWAKTTNHEERLLAHIRAMEILREMENLYTNYTTNNNNSNNDDEHIIAMDNDNEDFRYHVKPSAITYATAIKAIGNSLADNAATLMETLLQRMYHFTETGTIHVPPTVETYNAVIMSLASLGRQRQRRNNSTRARRAQRAEELLNDMIRRSQSNSGNSGDNFGATVAPNVRTWGAVLKAWADCGRPDAGEQAQRVLDQMEDAAYSNKNYSQQQGSSNSLTVIPNVICYTTVMNAWARGSSTGALERIEQLLQHMEDLYSKTGDARVRPNKISYVTVMDAYGRKLPRRQAAIQAQAIVDRMMKLYALDQGYDRPTRIVFNALINAYSKSDDRNAAFQAEKIFRWMESQYRTGDDYVKPDEVTLCGVLNAWANHAANGGAQRAQEILDHTEALSLEERGFAHSIVCYNILIKAWGRSRDPDSVQRAAEILEKLERQQPPNGGKYSSQTRPDVTTYSSVINCCAYFVGDEAGRQRALEVALETFAKIQKDGDIHDNNNNRCEVGPNNITFGTLFKAIAKLMPIGLDREKLIVSLFERCKDLGQVDSFVLSQVKAATTSDVYRRLVLESVGLSSTDNVLYDEILKCMPRKWGKNIVSWDG